MNVSIDVVLLINAVLLIALIIRFVACFKENRRLKYELKLQNKDSEALIQEIIDAIPHPLFYKDLNFCMKGVNVAYQDAFSSNKQQLIGKFVMDLDYLSLKEREKFLKEDENVIGSGLNIREERSIMFRDGKLHHTLYCKKSFQDNKGNPAGILGVFVDFSELFEARLAEQNVRNALAKEIEEKNNIINDRERYFSAIQRMNQPIVWVNANGDIIEANSAFITFYGYSIDEIIGKNPRILNPGINEYINLGYTETEYKDKFQSMWEDILNPSVGFWEGNLINKKKDNSLVWVNLKISTHFDSDGNALSIIGLPLDITEKRKQNQFERMQAFRAIADLAELRDNETGAHMKRVGIFSRLLAKGVGLSKKFCDDIVTFAPLHDIGKVGILDSILTAHRKLTAEEFEVMKTHTVLGYNIVKDKPGFEMAADIILNHHEKFNGDGYPRGLKYDDIPLSAQIVAIADVYDALRSRRPYKAPIPHNLALLVLQDEAGKQFNPRLIEAFCLIEGKIERVYEEVK